jgi:RHS repeat-associated protein
MAGISSKAAGGIENKQKFTSQILDDDFGLNWYQMRFRNMDPQIGRFVQIDPLAPNYVHNSTYAYAENDVIRAIDLEGLEKYIVTVNQVNKRSNISKVTVAQIQHEGKAQENSLKFNNGRQTPTNNVLVSTDGANINGNTNDYQEKGALNKGEEKIRDKGKTVITEVGGDTKGVYRTIEEGNTTVATGNVFSSPGDQSIESTGYVSGISFNSPNGKLADFNVAVDAVFKQIGDLKNQVKNLDLKNMVITLTTTSQNEGTMGIIKDFVNDQYKGAQVNIVVDDKAKSLEKKNAAFNSTIYGVQK